MKLPADAHEIHRNGVVIVFSSLVDGRFYVAYEHDSNNPSMSYADSETALLTAKRLLEWWEKKAHKPGASLVIDGEMYEVGREDAPGPRGHGGRKFLFRLLPPALDDVTVRETTNLWHQGTVPVMFRDRLPDNAIFAD